MEEKIDKSLEDIANKVNEAFKSKEYTKKREEYNTKIINLLTKYFSKYPHIRFGQAIIGLELSEYFYEEPWITHERLEKNINNLK